MILSPDFPDHYKTKILLKMAGHAGVFSLIKLWAQCQFRRTERIEKPAEIVAAIADWEGDPMAFEQALIKAGFAHREGSDFILHQWAEHNKRILNSWDNGSKGGRPKEEAPKPKKLKL